MREHPLIQGPPGSRIVLPDFDAPINLEDRYAQRLTAYLLVNMKVEFFLLIKTSLRFLSEKMKN